MIKIIFRTLARTHGIILAFTLSFKASIFRRFLSAYVIISVDRLIRMKRPEATKLANNKEKSP